MKEKDGHAADEAKNTKQLIRPITDAEYQSRALGCFCTVLIIILSMLCGSDNRPDAAQAKLASTNIHP